MAHRKNRIWSLLWQFVWGCIRALGVIIGIFLKLLLACMYLISKLLEVGLVHLNRAAELVLMGKEYKR